MLPNSSLDLISSVEVAPDINLSSLRYLGNGSEPISAETMKKFQEKFSSCGLGDGVLHACYMSPEHAVFVCGSQEGEELMIEGGKVSCGRPHPSVIVKVVDPETRCEMGDGEEGEMWVLSNGNAEGYWGGGEMVSEATFMAQLVGDTERSYLRTGDMGCILAGHIFISGRRENLMVAGERQFYMNQVEQKLETRFPELRRGRTAVVEWDSALALADHSPSPTKPQAPRVGLGIFAELCNEESLQATQCHTLAEKIATRVGLDFRVETQLVALLPLGTMPCTGSGEKHRPLCKAKLLTGTLHTIYHWTPSSSSSTAGLEIKPEFIPLPPTPIPPRQTTTTAAMVKMERESPKLTQSPPKIPELKLETSPTAEKVAGIPRKESRFCLEDAPVVMERGKSPEPLAVTAEPITPHVVDHLLPPGAAEKEKARVLVGQEAAVLSIISCVLDEYVGMDSNIWDLGCDSLCAAEISTRLEQHLGFSVEPHLLFAYQTPRALLEKLKRTLFQLCSPVGVEPAPERGVATPGGVAKSLLAGQEDEVAIVAMACRLPGCSSPEELWLLQMEKTVSISHFQDQERGRWIHGGFTEKMSNFDHNWFGISQKEASTMDPQQSILLHTATECLQRSGYTTLDEIRGSNMGVFVGYWGSDAHTLALYSENPPPYTGYIGTMTANRISYTFDLKGPSMVIDTACAASLTALEVACIFLQRRKCSEALVGGVNALLDGRMFDVSSEMGAISPRGESQVFDASASGYVRGEGCGVVLLKRVRDAIQDGNRILAVVKSVESRHNGRAATLTAPNKQSQVRLLRTALTTATLGPWDITYLEAHGTGTPLGDPMEMSAIREVFAQPNDEQRGGPLIVGSIKANVGHLEAAAGVAGVIKTVLVLEHAKAPGCASLQSVNPALKIDQKKILLPQEATELDSHTLHHTHGSSSISPNLLSASVSSFGIGGSIASAVLQQFSQLPHLGQVKCSLILVGEVGDVTRDQVMAAIQLLRARFFAFNSAYVSCVEAFQKAIKPVKILASDLYYHHPAYLMFCLLYGVVKTLQTHGVNISFAMGTTLCAEVVVLALADVLILSDAMRLLLAGLAPQLFNIKFITEDEMQPAASFLSPTLNHLCLPGRFSPVSLNQLIDAMQHTHLMLPTCSDPTLATNYVSIAQRGYGSLLIVTLDPDAPIIRAASSSGKPAYTLQLQSSGLVSHFRETFLELRGTHDKMIFSKMDAPSPDVQMPGFYQRYPMRAALRKSSSLSHSRPEVKVQDRPSMANRSEETKSKHRLSCADESGYLTQTTSAESLKNSTPVASPDKLHPKPHPLTTPNSPPPKSDMSLREQKVFDRIMSLVRSELLPGLTLPDRKAGEKELKALGLDSVALLEIQDHLLQQWEVDIPLQRLTSDLNTVNSIAREVAGLCAKGEREGRESQQGKVATSSHMAEEAK